MNRIHACLLFNFNPFIYFLNVSVIKSFMFFFALLWHLSWILFTGHAAFSESSAPWRVQLNTAAACFNCPIPQNKYILKYRWVLLRNMPTCHPLTPLTTITNKQNILWTFVKVPLSKTLTPSCRWWTGQHLAMPQLSPSASVNGWMRGTIVKPFVHYGQTRTLHAQPSW